MKSLADRVRLFRLLFFAVFFATVLSTGLVFAGTGNKSKNELAEVVTHIEARYDTLQSVSAVFTQEVLSAGMATPMTSGGLVWFKKPSMMRWLYSSGTADELIGNGEKVWLYQPELNQVIETEASRVSSVVTDFLTGVGSLSNDFNITLLSKGKSAYSLLLIPKSETVGVSKLILDVGAEDYVVFRTTVEDAFGTTTTVTFKEIRFDVVKEDSFFSFVSPAGINIIAQ